MIRKVLIANRGEIAGAAGIGKGIAYVNDKKVCEAELTFMVG